MFYDTFLLLCKNNNEKPTPVLKILNLSPGNLEKWKNGATVNSDVLLKVAEHFGVSTDYLLGNEQKNKPVTHLDELNAAEKRVIELFRLVPADQQQLVANMIEAALKSQGLLK